MSNPENSVTPPASDAQVRAIADAAIPVDRPLSAGEADPVPRRPRPIRMQNERDEMSRKSLRERKQLLKKRMGKTVRRRSR